MSSEKPIQKEKYQNRYIQKAEIRHKLHDNPYLKDPKRFTQISHRIARIQHYFLENEEPNVCRQPRESQPSSEVGVERRALDELFTTLILIQPGGGVQHFVFREHYYTDYKAPPFRGQYHKHDFIELSFVIKGSFEQILLGESRRFSAGEVVITDKNCEHADLITDAAGTVLFLWIQSDFLDQILRYYDGTDSLYRFLFHALRERQSEQRFLHLVPKTDSSEVEYILEQLVYENYKRGPGYQEIVKWNLLRLFHLLCEEYALQLYSSGQEGKERLLLYEVEQYIGLHLAQVTIQDLEAHFHYQRNYYNLLLKKYLGKSFRDYVQNLRMDQAAKLLTSTDLTVKQVAEQVGYENSSFFYHLFERYFQMGPMEYRKRFREWK